LPLRRRAKEIASLAGGRSRFSPGGAARSSISATLRIPRGGALRTVAGGGQELFNARRKLSTWSSIAKPAQAAEGRGAGRQSRAVRSGFNPRGVVTAVSHAYIRPSLGNAIATAGAGTARLLLSSAVFVRFRAPIDSVTDPGGQPRRPRDPFLSLRCGFGPSNG
jgi:hypothetical protein